MHNSGGVDCKLLKAWMNLGFPASPTVPASGIPLASPEHNVVVDPVKEMALWDKWGREAWLIIVASEEDWIVDNGYTFEVSQAQFAFDLSLFAVPSSPFVNVFPYYVLRTSSGPASHLKKRGNPKTATNDIPHANRLKH